MKPQNTAVLNYLRKQSLTPLEAERHLGTMRLAARVHELREAGYEIRRAPVRVKTRNGFATVARYTLLA